jgi:hypothetical protein
VVTKSVFSTLEYHILSNKILGQENTHIFFIKERIPPILATHGLDSIRRITCDKGIAMERKNNKSKPTQGAKE